MWRCDHADDNSSQVFRRGPFQIRRSRPGLVLGSNADVAFGPLSVIDQANLGLGTVVRMHEHNNDEILSYMWRGEMIHEDSAGHRIPISAHKLMMMNAGRSFWHEESTPDGPVEMLQIFIRPREADLPGDVPFFDRPDNIMDGRWHLVARPQASDAPRGQCRMARSYATTYGLRPADRKLEMLPHEF